MQWRYWRYPDGCDQVWGLVDRSEDLVSEDCEYDEDDPTLPRTLEGDSSDRGGGAFYGIELGYRPSGEDSKWEVVLTPYFRTQIRKIAPGQKFFGNIAIGCAGSDNHHPLIHGLPNGCGLDQGFCKQSLAFRYGK